MNLTVVLEEVEMPPLLLLEVVGLAQGTADRARASRPPIGLDAQVWFVGMLAGVQALVHQPQGGLQTKPRSRIWLSFMLLSSSPILSIPWDRLQCLGVGLEGNST